ncbi:MAG: hypothetical protein ISR64_01835 [Deltaproteobacteria bacterium]|nr:hypothetical protein [Deltaproteobacteria bacterium]
MPRRLTHLLLLPALIAAAGCIKSIDAPECVILADCPPDEAYNSCEDGYCFKEGKCAQAGFKPNDSCCPPMEGDRTGDTDCLVMAEYFGDQVSVPAFDAQGNLFVTYASLDPDKGSMVLLERLAPADLQSNPVNRPVPVEVGPGASTLAPMITRNVSVYAAFDGGVNRYDAETLDLVAGIESKAPEGGLAFASNGGRSVVAWPTAGGVVVTYDEDGGSVVSHDLVEILNAPPLAKAHFHAPVISGNGHRLYVTADSGHLVAVEVGVDPLGPVASLVLPSLPAGPPVESGGRVFVVTANNFLTAYRANDDFSFDFKWQYNLGGPCAGRPLLDAGGDLVLARRNGRVLVIRDFDSKGSMVGEGDFGEPLADTTPLLTDHPRLVALGDGGLSVLSLLRADDNGTITLSEGLRFDLEFPTTASPTVRSGRLILPLTSSWRLLAWTLADESLPLTGFPRDGGFADNTNQVIPPM